MLASSKHPLLQIGEVLLGLLAFIAFVALWFVHVFTGWIAEAYARARYLLFEFAAIAITIAAVAVFVGFGVSYWFHYPGLSWQLWQRCAYDDPTCSVAAATWALGTFALCSFLAAGRAVFWTRKLFEIEVQLKLGQSRCVDRSDQHIKKEVFVTEEGQVLTGSTPAGFSRDDVQFYWPHHVDFVNLGRTALADVLVKFCFVDQNNVRYPLIPLNLGSIRCDDDIHVAVYIAKRFHDMRVLWGDATEQGRPLRFFAVDALSGETTFALPDHQLPLPPIDQAAGGQPQKAEPPNA